MSWWLGLVLSCALHVERSGLISSQPPVSGDGDGVIVLTELEGRTTRLIVEGEGTWLAGCDGCEVTVTGPARFGKLRVREFEVRRANDGSQPYVGILTRRGAQLVIDDRTTGQPILLDPGSASGLLPYEGRPVLVIGFVVGAQTIRVMAFRVLDEPPAPAAAPEP
jgi:hypothetical protein